MNDSKNSINEFLNQLNNKIRLSDFIGQFVQLSERETLSLGGVLSITRIHLLLMLAMINLYFIVLVVKLVEI